MSKAFAREDAGTDEDDEDRSFPSVPSGTRNYITPTGYQSLRTELRSLINDERPKVVEAVHWAARNGDRSENGDYLYGKKRLREIDRRIRYLTKRLEIAEITEPSIHYGGGQVFFGATVVYVDDMGVETRVRIVGTDEADALSNEISWVSPVARVLLKSQVGDLLKLVTPAGTREIEVLSVDYPNPAAA